MGKTFGKLAIPFFSRNLVHQTIKKIYYDPEKITEDQIDAYWLPYQMEGGREVVVNILRSFDQDILQQVRQSYTQMKMPILLVWGEQDNWIPISHLAYLLEDFPHAEQVTIPYCGHAPQEETADEVNPQLIQFLHKHSDLSSNSRQQFSRVSKIFLWQTFGPLFLLEGPYYEQSCKKIPLR